MTGHKVQYERTTNDWLRVTETPGIACQKRYEPFLFSLILATLRRYAHYVFVTKDIEKAVQRELWFYNIPTKILTTGILIPTVWNKIL